MSEAGVKNDIVSNLSCGPSRLFKFQCGTFELADGRFLTVGVPGMSDLLGWKTIEITPDMVGRFIPVYCAIEVKKLGGRTEKKRLAAQKSFVSEVKRHGGIAGFATSVEEARTILNQAPGVVVCPHDESQI